MLRRNVLSTFKKDPIERLSIMICSCESEFLRERGGKFNSNSKDKNYDSKYEDHPAALTFQKYSNIPHYILCFFS